MSRVFSASNFQSIVSKVEALPLPSDAETIVHIKQLPMGILRRLAPLATQDGDAGDDARCELIRRSVVNPDGSPVFDSAYPLMDEITAELLNDLMVIIGKANIKNASSGDMDKKIEEAEKNSEPTS